MSNNEIVFRKDVKMLKNLQVVSKMKLFLTFTHTNIKFNNFYSLSK